MYISSEDKQQFKFGDVMTEHHMNFFAMFFVLLFAIEDK